MTAQLDRPPGDVRLKADRDADARGLQGIWASVGDEFLSAIAQGKLPVLIGDGEGATSGDEPVIAVGNRPYNGSNPPKYLNAEFNSLEVQDAQGQWVATEQDTQQVTVAADKPVPMRASVGNNGWAKWLSTGEAGRVYLVTSDDSPAQVRAPIPQDVPRLGDATIAEFEVKLPAAAETKLTFEMLADERARFGEKLTVVLVPAR